LFFFFLFFFFISCPDLTSVIMAAVAQDFSAPSPAKATVSHPLCPLTAAEIATTADLVRSVWPAQVDLRFKVITLEEPPKQQMVPYLEAEHKGAPLPAIPRKSFISYYIRNTVSPTYARRPLCCQVLRTK
jgi:Cu2+-containing amine oxidase